MVPRINYDEGVPNWWWAQRRLHSTIIRLAAESVLYYTTSLVQKLVIHCLESNTLRQHVAGRMTNPVSSRHTVEGCYTILGV